jgi:hypothetical protein
MKKSISRRSFLLLNGQIGLATVAGSTIFPGILENIIPENTVDIRKNQSYMWSVKKEVHAPSPEPRAGISLSMCYIGSGLKREEIQAIIRSSDWVEKPRKRISADNGRTWSGWEIIDEKSKIQGAI